MNMNKFRLRRATTVLGLLGLLGLCGPVPGLSAAPTRSTTASASAATAAPAFSLPAHGGGTVSLAQLRGQVVMINIWASWCGPCRQEMPLLENIYRKYHSRGFTLVGVSIDDDPKAADAFLQKTPVSFPVLYDTASTLTGLYRVQGMPSSAFIDRKGQLHLLHEGYATGDEKAYIAEIEKLLGN